MNSSRPYLLRAFFEWILDNDLTPYLVISADMSDVLVPRAYVEEGRIILNITPDSIRNLVMANDHLEFYAKFGGVEQQVYAPMYAIQAIYAKENGRGMVFQEEEDEWGDDGGNGGSGGHLAGASKDKDKSGKPGKPTLTIVK